MYIIKNAIRCIGRSKGRNVLIGIIVLVIAVSSCIGFSIREAAKSAKESALEGLSVTATISVDRSSMMGEASGGGEFNRDDFLSSIGGASSLTLEEYKKYAEASSVSSFYYTSTASLNGSTGLEPVVSSESDNSDFEDVFGDMSDFMQSSDFSLIGYSSDEAMASFIDGTATIIENGGQVFEEGTTDPVCIISEELAIYNSLSVGSVITLTHPDDSTVTYELTVVGIYSETSSDEGFSFGGMSFSFSDPANKIYTSTAALSSLAAASSVELEESISATYVFATADDYYTFEEEVRTMGLSETYAVSSQDISAFESSFEPLNTLSTMSGWFLLVILLIGAAVLIVLNIFNIRERKYEIGVLCAMGMKKIKVSFQFLSEIFIVTIIAVTVGIGIGAVSAVPVTNALLESQISSANNRASETQMSFGRPGGGPGGSFDMENMPEFDGEGVPSGGGFGGMLGDFGKGVGNYISEVNSAMNLTVVLEMFGIAVLLTLIAGSAAMLFVMRYEPLKILSNRD